MAARARRGGCAGALRAGLKGVGRGLRRGAAGRDPVISPVISGRLSAGKKGETGLARGPGLSARASRGARGAAERRAGERAEAGAGCARAEPDAGCWAGDAEEEAGRRGRTGRLGLARDWAAGKKGKEGVGQLWLGFWAGLVFSFSGFSYPFLFQTALN